MTGQTDKMVNSEALHIQKAVNGYLKQVLHSAPSTLYVIRKEWKALKKEYELLLELFKEAVSGNLDKAALLLEDPFKPVRDEIADSTDEAVQQLNEEFDYILATVVNAGMICGGNMQQADLLKSNIDLNYIRFKFRSSFGTAEFELLQFEAGKSTLYLGNSLIMDIVLISITRFLLDEIKKSLSGKIVISEENWGRQKIIEFQCTATSSREAIDNIFDNITDDGIDLGFCKKAMQLFNGDLTVALNSKSNIVFTLTLPIIRD